MHKVINAQPGCDRTRLPPAFVVLRLVRFRSRTNRSNIQHTARLYITSKVQHCGLFVITILVKSLGEHQGVVL